MKIAWIEVPWIMMYDKEHDPHGRELIFSVLGLSEGSSILSLIG